MECDSPADVGYTGYEDLAICEFTDVIDIFNYAHSSGDDTCCAGKTFDVLRHIFV